jgi:hypothetical protein
VLTSSSISLFVLASIGEGLSINMPALQDESIQTVIGRFMKSSR